MTRCLLSISITAFGGARYFRLHINQCGNIFRVPQSFSQDMGKGRQRRKEVSTDKPVAHLVTPHDTCIGGLFAPRQRQYRVTSRAIIATRRLIDRTRATHARPRERQGNDLSRSVIYADRSRDFRFLIVKVDNLRTARRNCFTTTQDSRSPLDLYAVLSPGIRCLRRILKPWKKYKDALQSASRD